MLVKTILFTFLNLLSLPVPTQSIKCVRCEDFECARLNIADDECPKTVKGCVSIVTEAPTETGRFTIKRDCFLEAHREFCTPQRLANGTCMYCDHVDACNVERKEALICKECHSVSGTQGFTCDTAVVCQPLYRTVPPFCQVSWANRVDGTHYGCWHRMEWPIRKVQIAFDWPKVRTRLCDSVNCNDGIEKLFDNHQHLLEERRYCHRGRKDKSSLTYCWDYTSQNTFIPFCIFSGSASTPSKTLRDHDCVLDQYTKGAHLRDYYFCNWNGCNAKSTALRYSCHGPNGREQFVFKSTDACVMYDDPFEGYIPLGRQQFHYCTDFRRCRICRSHLCNTEANLKRLFCYHTNGPEGYYIRREQLEFMDMCAEGVTSCATVIEGDQVWRGCANSSQPSSTSYCTGHMCNNKSWGTYCYKCSISDPNCVFSQGNGRQFEFCPAPLLGCYTRTYGDGSVERGCAAKREDHVLDTTYLFCDEQMLCNGLSTKRHSCHLFQGLTYKMPQLPAFVRRPWVTEQGVAFETCRDELGLPACFTWVFISDMKAYSFCGCTNEITLATFLNYRRGYGSLAQWIVLCDGHYCNRLPLDGPSWIAIGGEGV